MSSWWDKYFAPGDLRARTQILPSSTNASSTEEGEKRPPPIIPQRVDAATRHRRQNALFYGGLGFTFLSLFLTRRSVSRKHISAAKFAQEAAAKPKDPNVPETPINMRGEGSLDGAEALFLATINLFAFSMAGIGAFMKWFDIGDVEDLRDNMRKNMGYDVFGGNDEADKELEAWVASVMINKEGTVDMSKDKLVSVMKELAALEEEKAKNGGKLSPEQMKTLLESRAAVTRMEVEGK